MYASAMFSSIIIISMQYANLHIDDIIIKTLNGLASADELSELLDWLNADEANRSYFEEQKAEWSAAGEGAAASSYDGSAAFKRFERRVSAEAASGTVAGGSGGQDSPRRIGTRALAWRLVAGIAAAVLVVFGLWAVYDRYTSQYIDRFANLVNVEAPAGSRAKVVLPDGTTVWLNAGSRMSYAQGFGITDRSVKIEGEGYFEVGSDSELPMSVCSDNMQVRDIGTKFNFRDYPEEPTAEVTLCDGEVGVKSVKFPGREVIIHPEQMTLLDKRTGRITATGCYSADKRLWTSGMLVMDGMTTAQIVNAIERAYKVKVSIGSGRVHRMQLCGTLNLDRENLEEVLKVIAKAGGIEYSIRGKNVLLK